MAQRNILQRVGAPSVPLESRTPPAAASRSPDPPPRTPDPDRSPEPPGRIPDPLGRIPDPPRNRTPDPLGMQPTLSSGVDIWGFRASWSFDFRWHLIFVKYYMVLV